MPEEDTQAQNPVQGPSHLVVEQGLFSRTTETPQEPAADSRAGSLPALSDEELIEEDAAAYKGSGILSRLPHLSLFTIILIPMVIIEIILLVLIIKH